jgi:hypothetical protein
MLHNTLLLIAELRHALTSAGDIESQLRAQLTSAQRDKLQADRNYTVGVSRPSIFTVRV